MNARTLYTGALVCLAVALSGKNATASEQDEVFPDTMSLRVEEPAPQPETRKPVEGTLWPGESQTFLGVTVTWKVGDEAPAEGEAESLGVLEFRGPETTLSEVPSAVESWRDEKTGALVFHRAETIQAYVDQTLFHIGGHVTGPAANLVVYARQYPSTLTFSAVPDREELFVSGVCPLSLNQWKVTVSKDLVKYPDGSQHLQLTATNTQTGETVTVPAVDDARRRFGRFDMTVTDVCRPTRTARLRVDVGPDEAVRGRDAYVEQLKTAAHETVEEVLKRLSEEYGFAIEWVQSPPGSAASVEYAKNLKVTSNWRQKGETLDIQLSRVLAHVPHDPSGEIDVAGPALNHEWQDPTHLRVWANYEEILEAKERKKEREKAIEQARQTFEREYGLQTRLYRLETMAAPTAKNLIDRELRTHVLAVDHIASYRSVPPKLLYSEKAEEQCTADERTNTLIVTAIPKTHEKVARLLHDWEKILAGKEARGPARRYQIEVALLAGGKRGEVVGDAARPTRLSFPVGGMVTRLAVTGTGFQLQKGDVIAVLDTANQRTLVKQAETLLAKAETRLEAAEAEFKRAEALAQNKTIGQNELTKAQAVLQTATLERNLAREELERARQLLEAHTLRAPFAGTVVGVSVHPYEHVAKGQTVVELMPEKSEAAVSGGGESYDPRLAERYGISKEDLERFGLEGLAMLGRGLVGLLAEKGETGRVTLSLSDAYRCELEFVDARPPYLVVKGRLVGEGSATPLLENTLFLEKDKPSMLGITNLRQALILVLRLRDAVGPEPAEAPAADPAASESVRRR